MSMLPTPYYQRDNVTIYCGDNADILPLLPAGGFDLVFMSPPYNLGTTTGGGFPITKLGHYADGAVMGRRGGIGKWAAAGRSGGIAEGYTDHEDAMPHAEYVGWQQNVLRACWRVVSGSGAIFYNHKPRILNGVLVSPFDYIPDELRGNLRQVVIWARAGGINFSPAFYLPTHEWIVVIAQSAFRLKSKGASGVGDVWSVPQQTNTLHPAPFPVALPARAIETTAPQSVLDPFMGSGTTLVAARSAGVPVVGIEKSERYCEIAARRLSQTVMALDIPA